MTMWHWIFITLAVVYIGYRLFKDNCGYGDDFDD